MEARSTESDRPREHRASASSWEPRTSPPPGARVRFALAAVLLLLWIGFLAYLAVVSGKRPEERERRPAVGAAAAPPTLQFTGHIPEGSNAGTQAG